MAYDQKNHFKNKNVQNHLKHTGEEKGKDAPDRDNKLSKVS